MQPSLWKPPEYYLSLIYDEDLPGPVKSTMTVQLRFEDGTLVGGWETATENPDAGLTWHLNNMFKNKDAPLRHPLQVQERIREFERRPVSCRVEPANELVPAGRIVSGRVSDRRRAQRGRSGSGSVRARGWRHRVRLPRAGNA